MSLEPHGISSEVADEHARRHNAEKGCDPDLAPETRQCICHRCTIVICNSCREPVFVAFLPGDMCRHAKHIIEMMGS